MFRRSLDFRKSFVARRNFRAKSFCVSALVWCFGKVSLRVETFASSRSRISALVRVRKFFVREPEVALVVSAFRVFVYSALVRFGEHVTATCRSRAAYASRSISGGLAARVFPVRFGVDK